MFNKGRYSRTRQIVKGAFFFSLILNVNVIFGTLFLYYLYTIKLTYLWWFFYILLSSFVFNAFLRRTALKVVFNLKIKQLSNYKKIFKKITIFKKIIIKHLNNKN